MNSKSDCCHFSAMIDNVACQGLTAAQLRRVALEMQRWAARYAETDPAVSKFLDRVEQVLADSCCQARRERRGMRT